MDCTSLVACGSPWRATSLTLQLQGDLLEVTSRVVDWELRREWLMPLLLLLLLLPLLPIG